MYANSLILTQVQSQTMSQSQIQALEFLAWTNLELLDFLKAEMLQNPILDLDETRTDTEDISDYHNYSLNYGEYYTRYEGTDDDISAKEIPWLPDETVDLVLGQLDKKQFSPQSWEIINFLINCLDPWGFLPYSIKELSDFGRWPKEEIRYCLNILKTIEPIGIFSKDVKECLLLQLKNQDVRDKTLIKLIKNYMPQLLKGHLAVIARELGLQTAQIREYINLIGSLNPRPLTNLRTPNADYIIPDICLRLVGDIWEIDINDNFYGEFKYDNYYINLMRTSEDKELVRYFKEKYERAKFYFSCIEQRRRTITNIIQSILEIQGDYFRYNSPLRPMCMEDVAELAEVHVSTVSRAIRSKYIQYKNVVLIKDLFTHSLPSTGVSVNHIKEMLRLFVEKEDQHKPLSDLKLSEVMKRDGVIISRRTVAKYRDELGIPDSRQRVYLG